MPLAHLDSFSRHPLVFLTVCIAKRRSLLDNAEVHLLLRTSWTDSLERNGWYVGRYVLMPDHVHLFATPAETPDALPKWISLWKSISSRKITAHTQAKAPIWQRDYFDRSLHTRESYGLKWDYVCNNPVRTKLVTKTEDWPYQGVIHDISH